MHANGYGSVMSAHVAALRRYPVKSMGGETLDRADVTERGIDGDRWFAVADDAGYFASGKTTRRFRRHDAVFNYGAHTGADGTVTVEGDGARWRIGDRLLDEELSNALGANVRIQPEDGVSHQDGGSVSLVSTGTLRWCARNLDVDADFRRLRVNIVVHDDEPFIEEAWLGSTIAVGGCALRVVARTERCRMVDITQDGVVPRSPLLKPLAEHRGMNLAVYADVATPGRISIGDPVTVT